MGGGWGLERIERDVHCEKEGQTMLMVGYIVGVGGVVAESVRSSRKLQSGPRPPLTFWARGPVGMAGYGGESCVGATDGANAGGTEEDRVGETFTASVRARRGRGLGPTLSSTVTS